MLRKNIFALASVLVLGLGVAACGDDNGGDTPPGVDPGPGDGGIEVEDCTTNPDLPQCVRADDARDVPVYSYLSGLGLPEVDQGEATCCVDYTGDGVLDNALVGLLGLVGSLASDVDVEELLTGVFEDGTLSLLFEHIELSADVEEGGPGGFDINLYLGDSESTWEDRSNHRGVFTKGDKVTEIKNALLRRGEISTQISTLPLTLDIDSLAPDVGLGALTLPLSFVDLKINAFEATGDGQAGIYNDYDGGAVTESGGKPINYLSALLLGEDVAGLLNKVLGENLCPEGGHDGTILIFKDEEPEGGEGQGLPTIEINPNLDVDAFSAQDDICETVGGFLDMIDIIGALFDVDSNGNDVVDALSLGLFVQFAGAIVE